MGSIMNGWDIIAATRQRVINNALGGIKGSYPVKQTFPINMMGVPLKADVDINIKPPKIKVRPGSGRQVDVIFPISGSVGIQGGFSKNLDNSNAIVTTDLLLVESELQPDKTNTYYDFIVNLKDGFIVDFKTEGTPEELAILVEIVKQILQELSNNKTYKLATIKMPKELKEQPALIPYKARYSFIEDPKDLDNSVLAILMLSKSKNEGKMYFNDLLLPNGSDAGLLISNELFMDYIVKPALIDGIKDKAKDKDEVASKITTKTEDGLTVVCNDGNIKVNADHHPWISDIVSKIDGGQLYAYLKVKANVTFMDIHVSTWVRDWYEFYVDGTEIKMRQTKEKKDESTSAEWWKWLIAAVLGPIYILVFGIIVGIVSSKVPSMGGSFSDIATKTVQWPNQKYVKLSGVSSPGDIIITTELGF